MSTITVKDPITKYITTRIGRGAECDVYDTVDKNKVFKLYIYSYAKVIDIIRLNIKYADLGLAPKVYSSIIEMNDRYGYIAEYVTQAKKVGELLSDELREQEDILMYELGIKESHRGELNFNWGLTKDNRPVLFDFGLYTMELLGLLDEKES